MQPAGVSKLVKTLLRTDIPDLGRLADVSEAISKFVT